MPDKNEMDVEVGRRIRQIRLDKGLRQGDLADLMSAAGFNVAQQTVAKIETGDRPLKLVETMVLAQSLGVPIEALFPGNHDADRLYHFQTTVSMFLDRVDSLNDGAIDLYESQQRLKTQFEGLSEQVLGMYFEQEDSGDRDELEWYLRASIYDLMERSRDAIHVREMMADDAET